MYDIIIKREILHEENFPDSQQLNKINAYQKRDFSQERKKIKNKIRIESSQIGNNNYNIDNFIYSTGNMPNNSKKKINNVKYINVNNFYKEVEYECEKKIDAKNMKENNLLGINIIFQNKEKAKTFNRQLNHKKIKNIPDSYKNKINLISNDSKNKTEKNKIYTKKLITDNIIYSNNESNCKAKNKISNNINNVIFNSKYILEPTNININSKRNTDSSIQILNKETINNEKINKSNKEKCNKVKAKINFDNLNTHNNIKYSISSKNIKCVRQPENLKKNIFYSNSFKKNVPSIPISNPLQKSNIEELLKKRKNIDINTEYQINPTENIFNLENNKFIKNLNYTTTNKVKLKSNNYIGNIEFEKEKEKFILNENNTIIKSRSKVKKLENKKEPELEIRIIDKKRNENIIFNNKRKVTNNSKVKNIDIYNNSLTEENARDNNNKIELNKNININNWKNNNNSKLSKVKILPRSNEQINKNNTYNNNDSSFFTINFNNSNIDENNNNELKPNLCKYNFVNNVHNNENTNNFNITNRINNTNGNFSDKNNSLKNKNKEINVIKSNSNTNKNVVLENFQISCENKIIFKNLTSNNNSSNCNTGSTSNNILNLNNLNNNINDFNKNEKEIFELEIKKKIIEENNINEKNKEEIVLIELDEEKGPKDNYLKNYKNQREISHFVNKKFMDDMKEKDLSLDRSSSLRVLQASPEEFIEKDDEVLKLLNSQSPRENIPPQSNIINIFNNFNNYIQQNNEEESEIIIQNSEFSMMNDPSKCNYIINNGSKNIYQNYNINGSNNNNIKESKNIIDNITMKDTSIMSNYGIKCCKSITQAGKERTGHRKKNQDNYIIEKNLNNILGFNLFAILDGHGENGHLVSQLASKYIIKKFTNITNGFTDTDIETIYEFFKKSDFQKIIDIFLEIDKEIIEQKKFDINLSGTTCVLVIQLGNHLICSNIGDSRAILIYDEDKIFELSHDSKPNVPEEEKRINMMGGVVDQAKDEDGEKIGPYRVYIKDKDQPGLAMSRSFGDKKAKSCGVIPYPDIIEFNLSNNDCKYMVLCSDGVWEFISNEKVMEIGNKYYNKNNINDFCNELLKKSTEVWESEENYMDDITIVIVFF